MKINNKKLERNCGNRLSYKSKTITRQSKDKILSGQEKERERERERA